MLVRVSIFFGNHLFPPFLLTDCSLLIFPRGRTVSSYLFVCYLWIEGHEPLSCNISGKHLLSPCVHSLWLLNLSFCLPRGSWTLSAFLSSFGSKATLQDWICSFPHFLSRCHFSQVVSLYTFECLLVLSWSIGGGRPFSSSSCSLRKFWAVGICLMEWQLLEGE